MERAHSWGMGVDEYFDIADALALELLAARSPEAAAKVDAVAVRLCTQCGKFHLRASLVDGQPGTTQGIGIELINRPLRKVFTELIETLLGHTNEAPGFDGRSLYDVGEAVGAILETRGIDVAEHIAGIGVKAKNGVVTLQAVFKDDRKIEGKGDGVDGALADLSIKLAAAVLQ